MFNEATFGEILLPSSGNVMLCIFKGNMQTLAETIKIMDKKLPNVNN